MIGKIKKSKETFDDIIMEYADKLSVENKVRNTYNSWVARRNRVKIKFPSIVPTDDDSFVVWMVKFSIVSIISLIISVPFLDPVLLVIGVIAIIFPIVCSLVCWGDWKIEKGYIKKMKIKELDKFEFLKSAYTGTISGLTQRLDSIKDKINAQISLHERDREGIKQYSDILSNTEEALNKIDSAIKGLMDSKLKVSNKKAEINRLLNGYIGKDGYITQKEAEIRRIKIAQELSDRMKNNFQTTMEIINNVDILTDAIIPAIKELIGFRIPELINQVEFECDKNRVLLEIKAS